MRGIITAGLAALTVHDKEVLIMKLFTLSRSEIANLPAACTVYINRLSADAPELFYNFLEKKFCVGDVEYDAKVGSTCIYSRMTDEDIIAGRHTDVAKVVVFALETIRKQLFTMIPETEEEQDEMERLNNALAEMVDFGVKHQ